MKTRVLSIVLFAILSSCASDSDIQPVMPPVANFETEKQYYDDGEIIQFENKSQNAISYLWTFGGASTSTEENPTYTAQLYNFLGHKFSVTLEAVGNDGSTHSTTKHFAISKRILHDIEITDISDAVRNRIPESETTSTQLIVYMGPANDPLEWIVPEQTLPPGLIEKDFDLPYKSNLLISWPKIGSNNSDWILRLSAQLKDETESRVTLNEFYFNPTKIDFMNEDEHIKDFTISDENMSLKVYFYYISI